MNCPICGNELRQSKKDPAYGLCDNCKKKFKLSEKKAVKKEAVKKESAKKETMKSASSVKGRPPVKSKPAKVQPPVLDDDLDMIEETGKKKGGCLKFLIIFILVIALACAALFFFGKKFLVEDTAEPQVTTESTEDTADQVVSAVIKDAYSVGDIIELNGIQVSLTDVIPSVGGDLASPSEGNIFLICEFDITNNSGAAIAINSLTDIEAYCDDYSITEDLTGLLVPEAESKASLDGTIENGQTLNGIIVYQIPETYTSVELRLDKAELSTSDIVFIIDNQ